jgi:hypothetical protein
MQIVGAEGVQAFRAVMQLVSGALDLSNTIGLDRRLDKMDIL